MTKKFSTFTCKPWYSAITLKRIKIKTKQNSKLNFLPIIVNSHSKVVLSFRLCDVTFIASLQLSLNPQKTF